jgi:hypothetical protein
LLMTSRGKIQRKLHARQVDWPKYAGVNIMSMDGDSLAAVVRVPRDENVVEADLLPTSQLDRPFRTERRPRIRRRGRVDDGESGVYRRMTQAACALNLRIWLPLAPRRRVARKTCIDDPHPCRKSTRLLLRSFCRAIGPPDARIHGWGLRHIAYTVRASCLLHATCRKQRF